MTTTAHAVKGDVKLYNDRAKCVGEMPSDANTPLKRIIDNCYQKSGEMIEQGLAVASNMFGDDFPKLPNKESEPQTLYQTAICTANRLEDLQNVLNAIYSWTLG